MTTPDQQAPSASQSAAPDGTRKVVWSVPDLLRIPDSENAWIIEGLLRPGSQMLLAGPPKSGKSLLASEMALALTLPFEAGTDRFLFGAGGHASSKFPGLKINPPANGSSWRVLFVSLEMGEVEVAGRLHRQLRAFGVDAPRLSESDPVPANLNFPLTHVFGLVDAETKELTQDLRIVETTVDGFGLPPTIKRTKHFEAVRDLIANVQPDVVIYDTLIQLHAVNENDNIAMKGVMRALRQASVIPVKDAAGKVIREQQIAHIVVHHTRKESNQYRAALSPEIMRGAGAVHGVADLVMLARKDTTTDTIEVNISSRSSSIPNFFVRIKDTLTHQWVPGQEKDKRSKSDRKIELTKKIILKLLDNPDRAPRTLRKPDLEKAIKIEAARQNLDKVGTNKETLQKRFDELRLAGRIEAIPPAGEARKNRKLDWEKCQYRRLGNDLDDEC